MSIRNGNEYEKEQREHEKSWENIIERRHFNASDESSIKITTRERLVMAWEGSMELARRFKQNSFVDENDPAGQLFAEAAELQGICAAKFHDFLKYQQEHPPN